MDTDEILINCLFRSIKQFTIFKNINFETIANQLYQVQQAYTKRLFALFIKERLIKPVNNSNKTTLSIPLLNAQSFSAKVNHYSLARLEINGHIFLQNSNSQQIIANPQIFLKLIKASVIADNQVIKQQWDGFFDEVTNGIVNETLYRIYRTKWTEELCQLAQKDNCLSLWQWIEKNKSYMDYLMFFEQWGAVGHPFHPNPKTRLGLSIEEVLNYSAEFRGEPAIQLAALHKDNAYYETTNDMHPNKMLASFFPQWIKTWQVQLKKINKNSNDFLALPVHPWHAQQILPSKFAQLIKQEKLLLLNGAKLSCHATTSLRTVAPKDNSAKTTNIYPPHIKLPVGFICTSTLRTVSPGSVRMSPRISHILQEILVKENYFNRCLDICADYTGIHYVEESGRFTDDTRFLSVLFRNNPLNKINAQEIIIPTTTLFTESPLTQKAILLEIMDAAGVKNKSDAQNYFFHYIKIALQAYFDLFLIYGIALEAHKQNTLAVFHQNKLIRFIHRDLGGIRIHIPSLQKQNYSLKRDVPSLVITEDASAARYKLLHTLFQDHFGSLVLTFTKYYEFAETFLWQKIAAYLQQRFNECQNRVSLERWQEEKIGMLHDNWPLKAFTRMRLTNAPEYIYMDLGENPLRE